MKKVLRDYLPYMPPIFETDKAYKYLDVEVIKEYEGFYRRFPGKHKNVHVWWELANGYAVGWNENPAIGWSFPVVKIKK